MLVKNSKQSIYPLMDWLIKCGISHTMKYQTAIKNNDMYV